MEFDTTTLLLVNKARAALGGSPLADLPRGKINDPYNCPLANALSDLVPGIRVEPDRLTNVSVAVAEAVAASWEVEVIAARREEDTYRKVPLPDPLSTFACLFDCGCFEKFIAR